MLDDRTLADHRVMLADRVRMEAYRRAIEATCHDAVVVEIGTGLGPLALMALRAGARRVYGIEIDLRTLGLATEILAHHGYGPDRFVPVLGHSDEVVIDEPADVLLSEILDSIGVGENVLRFVDRARRRWLRAGGVCVPGSLEVDVALARSADFVAECRLWQDELPNALDLDFGAVLDRLLAPRRSLTVTDAERLTPWTTWIRHDFAEDAPPAGTRRVELRPHRTGVANGIAFAFRARLAPGVTLSNHPSEPATHWQQGWLPLAGPVPVVPEIPLRLDLELPPTDDAWAPVQAELDLAEAPLPPPDPIHSSN